MNKTVVDEYPMLSDKKILYLDMDGVLVDFESAFPHLSEEIMNEYNGRLDEVPGIFSLMSPMEKAIESVQKLSEAFDLYILSTAPWDNSSAWFDKIEWVKKHFGNHKESPVYKRLVLSHNKHLNEGSFLVDDRPHKNGAQHFRGEVVHFGSETFPNWEKILPYLLSKA